MVEVLQERTEVLRAVDLCKIYRDGGVRAVDHVSVSIRFESM